MAGLLTTTLDREMLTRNGAIILPPLRLSVDSGSLPLRPGDQVSQELGGRYLLRYVPVDDESVQESSRLVYVTPTPFEVDELAYFLLLPRPSMRRPFNAPPLCGYARPNGDILDSGTD